MTLPIDLETFVEPKLTWLKEAKKKKMVKVKFAYGSKLSPVMWTPDSYSINVKSQHHKNVWSFFLSFFFLPFIPFFFIIAVIISILTNCLHTHTHTFKLQSMPPFHQTISNHQIGSGQHQSNWENSTRWSLIYKPYKQLDVQPTQFTWFHQFFLWFLVQPKTRIYFPPQIVQI